MDDTFGRLCLLIPNNSIYEHQHLVLSEELRIQHLSPTALQEQKHLLRKDDINSD